METIDNENRALDDMYPKNLEDKKSILTEIKEIEDFIHNINQQFLIPKEI